MFKNTTKIFFIVLLLLCFPTNAEQNSSPSLARTAVSMAADLVLVPLVSNWVARYNNAPSPIVGTMACMAVASFRYLIAVGRYMRAVREAGHEVATFDDAQKQHMLALVRSDKNVSVSEGISGFQTLNVIFALPLLVATNNWISRFEVIFKISALTTAFSAMKFHAAAYVVSSAVQTVASEHPRAPDDHG